MKSPYHHLVGTEERIVGGRGWKARLHLPAQSRGVGCIFAHAHGGGSWDSEATHGRGRGVRKKNLKGAPFPNPPRPKPTTVHEPCGGQVPRRDSGELGWDPCHLGTDMLQTWDTFRTEELLHQ